VTAMQGKCEAFSVVCRCWCKLELWNFMWT